MFAPLFFVSDGQINFLMPPEQIAGAVHVRVVREGLAGPDIIIEFADGSSGFFPTPDGYAVAPHAADFSLITHDNPAHGGSESHRWRDPAICLPSASSWRSQGHGRRISAPCQPHRLCGSDAWIGPDYTRST